MSRPVVLICLESPHSFWHFADRHAHTLRSAFPAVDFRVASSDSLNNQLPHAHVYFGWRFAADGIGLATRLVWIASPAAGTDHLPTAEAAAAGITVTRGYGYHAGPMTEHALGLILGFARGLFTSSRFQRTRNWWKDDLATEFFDLAGATLTVLGCGSIGTRLARTAQGLGMRVIGIRRTVPPDASSGITWMPATQTAHALALSDVVVNLLPATDDTWHFFDSALLNACKTGALFVNLGRGSTVDHTALLKCLDTGRLGGAALDVTEPRPLPMAHPLRRHPRVVLTPKSAAFSHRYMDEAVDFFAANLRRYLDGLPLNGVVLQPAPTPGGQAR
ncbi:D-2-hydroxyacid dehydrogenase [Phytoactinopolyspora mesophila]|uniref:D-2-hydroxyacid dehydrogenase n=1 Tax=Phytoactinopolyspora mesophila TaxID=2650750 RepID=A0A7K3MDI3_9ACTN|nr:D-2-hydroxyacid dehydrogenase [Phytoactinopolyspora mesophila]NDL61117.1 D-2-hydroxyacid dehydrogenase [Phytoactinopolyspora mesophila]